MYLPYERIKNTEQLDEILKSIEHKGFAVTDGFERPCEICICGEKYTSSPAYGYQISFHSEYGIEYSIFVDYDPLNQVESFKENMCNQIVFFNIDEQIEMLVPFRGKDGVPSSFAMLLHDATNAKSKFLRLGKAVL